MQKSALRAEVNRKIQAGHFEAELVTFRVHTAKNLSSDGQTLAWEHDEEFAVNGDWYDVVDREVISADSIMLRVLPDKGEKEVYALLARQAEQDPGDEGNAASRFLDFLDFSAIPHHFRFFLPGELDPDDQTEYYHFSLLPHKADILSPPPQVA